MTGGPAQVRSRRADGVAQPRPGTADLRRVRGACAPAGAASRSRNTTAGGSEYTPPNVEHWHGATPSEPLVQVNIQFGGTTKWLTKTTDEEYNRKKMTWRAELRPKAWWLTPTPMDRAFNCSRTWFGVDSVNPSLVLGAAGEAAHRQGADGGDPGRHWPARARTDRRPGPAQHRRRARRRGAGTIADVLRPHRYRRRGRHVGAVQRRGARWPASTAAARRT